VVSLADSQPDDTTTTRLYYRVTQKVSGVSPSYFAADLKKAFVNTIAVFLNISSNNITNFLKSNLTTPNEFYVAYNVGFDGDNDDDDVAYLRAALDSSMDGDDFAQYLAEDYFSEDGDNDCYGQLLDSRITVLFIIPLNQDPTRSVSASSGSPIGSTTGIVIAVLAFLGVTCACACAHIVWSWCAQWFSVDDEEDARQPRERVDTVDVLDESSSFNGDSTHDELDTDNIAVEEMHGV
jgi:hypothetical protein